MIRKILLGFLALTLISVILTLIGLSVAGYKNISVKQRVVVNGKFQPWGLVTPVQIEGTKSKIVEDSIVTTQSYVWGEKFSTVAMQNGEDVRMKNWSDSIQKELGAGMSEIEYLWGKSKLAEKAHGGNLEELLKGKTFTKVTVNGYASSEAGTPGSLLPDSIDDKNVLLAQSRAGYTLETVRTLFRTNGKNIDTIETQVTGKELQLDPTTAQRFATPNGFEAVKASNRSGKDTLGFNAHSALSKQRFTELKVNFTEDSKKTLVVTQPLLLLFLILFPLWQLLKWIFGRKLPENNFKWPTCGGWGTCNWSWSNCGTCTCDGTEPTKYSCCFCRRMPDGKLRWRCCFAFKRLWKKFWNWLKDVLFELFFWLVFLIFCFLCVILAPFWLLWQFLKMFWEWLTKKRECQCFWWKVLCTALAITVAILAWILYNKPC